MPPRARLPRGPVAQVPAAEDARRELLVALRGAAGRAQSRARRRALERRRGPAPQARRRLRLPAAAVGSVGLGVPRAHHGRLLPVDRSVGVHCAPAAPLPLPLPQHPQVAPRIHPADGLCRPRPPPARVPPDSGGRVRPLLLAADAPQRGGHQPGLHTLSQRHRPLGRLLRVVVAVAAVVAIPR
eukprot:3662555-Prymnesium_polylepis.2